MLKHLYIDNLFTARHFTTISAIQAPTIHLQGLPAPNAGGFSMANIGKVQDMTWVTWQPPGGLAESESGTCILGTRPREGYACKRNTVSRNGARKLALGRFGIPFDLNLISSTFTRIIMGCKNIKAYPCCFTTNDASTGPSGPLVSPSVPRPPTWRERPVVDPTSRLPKPWWWTPRHLSHGSGISGMGRPKMGPPMRPQFAMKLTVQPWG